MKKISKRNLVQVSLVLLGLYILFLGFSALSQPGFADQKVVIGESVKTPRFGIYKLILTGAIVLVGGGVLWYKDKKTK
jgi:hypothetical protein